MSHPRVSVICIFYNAERFFAEAIDSVLAQDFPDYELLLVDDGSSDGSTALARDYTARHPGRIRYLEHPGHANRGMSATRNLGLDNAAGEYIAFIDADDRWRPHKLREQVALLDANPEAGMVCGAVNYWRSWDGGSDVLTPTGPVSDGISRPPRTSLALYPLGTTGAPCPSDVLIRHSVFGASGRFEESFTGAYEDQAFFSKLYLVTPIYLSSRVWLDYRLHANSFMTSVIRDGGYPEVRRYFLTWFRDYLEPRQAPGKDRILAAIDKALWRLDHPRIGRMLRVFSRLTTR